MTDRIVTAHLSAHHAWQGPASGAPRWVLGLLDAVSGGTDAPDAERASGGQEIEPQGRGVCA